MPKRRFTDAVREDMAAVEVMHKLGPNGVGKSTVATHDGTRWMK